MLTKIHLTNFKVHRDLEIQFGSGLQTIRGAVEAGKSSLVEAIAYALLGSSALPSTLAETVTWGQPESSLRVELEFLHAGQPFSIYRGKSGAELTGAGVRASGQAEVTRFCENLFGCTAAVAKQVLLAAQGDLRGALDAGPGEAVQLIEKLGNVDLLDVIVGKIQDQLPCGSTLALDTLIAREVGVTAPDAVDYSAEEKQIHAAQVAVEELGASLAEVVGQLNLLDVAGANQALGTARAAADRLGRARLSLSQTTATWNDADRALQAEAAKPVVDIEVLIQQKAQAADAVRQRRVRARMLAIPETDEWEGSLDSLKQAVSEAEKLINDCKRRGQEQAVLVARLQGQIITETACGLCGKDLTNVPEVVTKNASLDAQIQESTVKQQKLKTDIQAATADMSALCVVLEGHIERANLAHGNPDLVAYTVAEEIPGTLSWLGPETIPETGTNFDAAIKTAQEAATRLTRLRNAAETSRAACVDAQSEERAAASVELSVSDPMQVLGQAEKLSEQVREANALLDAAKTTHQNLIRSLEQAKARAESQAAEFNAAQARLVDLRKDVAAMHLHNQVIKRVREARPVVANKLWDLVLSSVSQYFSKMRGTPSSVYRGDKGFSVDGHPVRSLSGSTKDILGLAIRLALAKTFLPALGFLILDEPAAACNDDRESAMLGLLSACDFDQILMVTHSDLADAYSTSIIQL